MPARQPPRPDGKNRPSEQRRSRRTQTLKPTRIELKGWKLPVNDISNLGIGVVIDPAGPSFILGERLEDIRLFTQDGTVSVKGVVSHISETAAARICGIQFLFEGDEFEAVLRFIKERSLPMVT